MNTIPPHSTFNYRFFKHQAPESKIARLWLYAYCILFLLGVTIAQIIPPLQSPDENAHLTRAYAISQGQWFLDASPNQSSGALVDIGFIQFMDGYFQNLRIPGWRPDAEIHRKLIALQWQFETTFLEAPATSYYNPIIYLPQASAIWLGQQLGLSVFNSYRLARLLTTFTTFCLVGLACYLYQPNPLVIGLLIMPMSLFQILMPTIDGICHGLTLFCLCWFCVVRQKTITHLAHILFMLVLVLLITSRIHAMPLLLLLLWLGPINGISVLRSRVVFVLGLFAVLFWALWVLNYTVDLRVWRPLSTIQIAQFYIEHPLQWFKIFKNTLANEELQSFYGKTFIGVLGWLHINLPQWYYTIYTLVLVALGMLSVDRYFFKKRDFFRDHLSFFLLALISMVLIWNMLLFTWTPFPNLFINGVQGRYFWIPACIFAFGLGGSRPPNLALNIFLVFTLIFNLALIFIIYRDLYH